MSSIRWYVRIYHITKCIPIKTRNIAVFLPKTGISIIETVPYSFSKVFQAFQPDSRCNQTSSIRWHERIFDIPKCIPIKPQTLGVFLPKTGIFIIETVPYSFKQSVPNAPSRFQVQLGELYLMACPDFRYSKVYSNKARNTAVFLRRKGISIIETAPYTCSKVFQAFQSVSSCNQTSSIRWHLRIFDIPKCISIKPQILGFFLPKIDIFLIKTVPYSFSKMFQAFQPGSRCN